MRSETDKKNRPKFSNSVDIFEEVSDSYRKGLKISWRLEIAEKIMKLFFIYFSLQQPSYRFLSPFFLDQVRQNVLLIGGAKT